VKRTNKAKTSLKAWVSSAERGGGLALPELDVAGCAVKIRLVQYNGSA
jgi:hypothetical protein